jgi:hypothetical protein
VLAPIRQILETVKKNNRFAQSGRSIHPQPP